MNQAVAYDQLNTAVDDFSAKLVALPSLSFRFLKEAVQFVMQMDLQGAMRMESRLFANCFGTEDPVEGVRAFREKKSPSLRAVDSDLRRGLGSLDGFKVQNLATHHFTLFPYSRVPLNRKCMGYQ